MNVSSGEMDGGREGEQGNTWAALYDGRMEWEREGIQAEEFPQADVADTGEMGGWETKRERKLWNSGEEKKREQWGGKRIGFQTPAELIHPRSLLPVLNCNMQKSSVTMFTATLISQVAGIETLNLPGMLS